MNLVSLRAVEKEYPLGKTVARALRGVDLDVGAGEFLCLVGPSGCGKTTLLNLLGMIDTPTSGSVAFMGQDVARLSDAARARHRLSIIGFIFQSFNLVPVLTVLENIELPMQLAGRPRSARRARASRLAALVGLSDHARHRPEELSGGERQRVAIARALANEPRLVIADEPTANLDSETGAAVLDEMRRLNRTEGVSFVFSTHDREIVSYASRVVTMRDGRIVGDPPEA